MNEQLNRYFCSVEHDAPLQLPELDELAQYFSQFDCRIIETNLSSQELMPLLLAKFCVDKDIEADRLKSVIDTMSYPPDTPDDDYTIVLKSKYRDRQELTITLLPLQGIARLLIENEDGEEVQL